MIGSSPLARGLPTIFHAFKSGPGIIPARAGFTWRAAIGGRSSMDHPRSRGVYFSFSLNQIAEAGSSPLARGLQCT